MVMEKMNVKQNTSSMLLDKWNVSGTKKEDMFNYLSELEASTKIFPSRTDEIQIFTLEYVDDKEKAFVGYRHGASYGTIEDEIPFAKLKKYDGMTKEILSETENDSKMLILMGNDVFFTTKKVLTTLSQRAGSSTGKYAAMDDLKIRFHRDAGYVAFMEAYPSSCNVMFRKSGNAKKIFAIFADSYTVLSQKELVQAIITQFEEKMGVSKLYYKINNYNTEITLEFPEYDSFKLPEELKENVIPGIKILISDTGESSFSVIGTIRIGTGICYVPKAFYNRKHTKNASVEEIVSASQKLIIPRFKMFPNKIKALKDTIAEDAETLVKESISYCGIKTMVSAKAEAAVYKNAVENISLSGDVTAYDISAGIVEACDYVSENVCQKLSEKLRTCSVKSIFYNYAS